jgi:hypothetical protein
VTITDDDDATTGAFEQDSGSDGIVSMEAENFDAEVARSSRDWNEVTSPSGYSGSGAMQALPNEGAMIYENIETTAPEMTYKVNFVKTGQHYIWVRGDAEGDGGSDSVHFGFNGSYVNTIYFNHADGYTWYRGTLGTVPSTGVHVVYIYMREAGFVCDKIVLTVNGSYEPTGTGPAESSQGAAESHTLTVVNGEGDGEYDPNDVVGILADAADTGSQFDVWTGDTAYVADVNEPNTTVTMPSSDITVTATYEYELTVTSGTGDGWYSPSDEVGIVADAPVAWMTFDTWTGDTSYVADVNEPNTTVTMPSDAVDVTATYEDINNLTVNNGTGDGNYPENEVVGISAVDPGTGGTFDAWTGDTAYVGSTSSASTNVTMPDADVTVTATFTYTLTVTDGTGDGEKSPNDVVDITADEPNEGWSFDAWTGDTAYVANTSEPNTTVTMPEADVSVTATYTPPAGGSVFQQDSGSDGICSMEAENYETIESGTCGDDWNEVTAESGYTGECAMQALPDDGDQVTTSIETAAAELTWEVNFVKTGTHYMWVRCHDLNSGGKDSVHFGMDDSQIGTIYSDKSESWQWKRGTLGNIASTGQRTINLYEREDGFIADKIVLTCNSSYTPSGNGPDESSQE